MADQKKRSDLIREQIETLLKNAPQPYTEAQKEQIMKGRGKRGSAQERQKEIDEGRATVERRNEEIRAFNQQISDLNKDLGAAEKDERQAGREEIEGATKKRYDEESSTGYGRAAQLGANALALPTGFGLGRLGGKGVNAIANISQESKNARLQGIAQDRINGLTTRKGALAGAERSGAMPSNNALLRVGGRMLPHALGGAGAIAKGGSMLANSFQEDDFYTDMTNRAMGLGLLGSGVGLIQEGANHAVNPKVAADGQAIAIIESEQLRRNGRLPGGAAADRGQIVDAEIVPDATAQKALPAPEPSQGPAPGSKAYYVQEAKRLGVKGVTRKSKADLVAAVNEANANNAGRRVKTPKVPGIAGPAIAGSLAYMMTPDDANASTGDDSVTGRDEALTNAGIAGGLTYGMGKVLPAGAGALAGGMMGPVAVMDGPTLGEEEAEETANWIARQAPGIASRMPGRIGAAYDKAQVPERSPANSGPRNSLASGIPYRDNALGADPQLETIFRELQTLMGQ